MIQRDIRARIALFLSFAITLILVLLPFHAILTTWAASNFEHFDLFRVWKEIILLAILPLVLFLAVSNAKLRKWLLSSWALRLYAVYVLLYISFGLWAESQGRVYYGAVLYTWIINLRFIGFFFICAIIASGSSFLIRNWRVILMAPAALVVFFGLMQRLILPYDFLRHFGYNSTTIPAYQTVDNNLIYQRLQSTLRGANALGAYLLLIATAIIGLRKNRIITYGSLLLLGAVLMYTYSRSAWIGTALSVTLVIWWAKDRSSKTKWLIGGVIAAIVVTSSLIYAFRFSGGLQAPFFHTTVSTKSQLTSNEERVNALNNGLRDVWNEPQGRGPGTAGPASFRNVGHHARLAENYYLQLAQEVGIVGLLIFIAINLIVGYQLWIKKKDLLARILLASLIGISFVNIISHAWTDDTLAYIWWGLAGIALAPALYSKSTGKKAGKVLD